MAWSRILSSLVLALCAGALQAQADTQMLVFSSPACGPCREMQPIVAQLARQGHAIREVDVEREPHIAQRFGVTGWPTFLVLVDGQERARLGGKTSHAQLVEMIDKATAIGASLRSSSVRGQSPSGSPLNLASQAAVVDPTADSFASGPTPGRLVDLQAPASPRPSSAGVNSSFGGPGPSGQPTSSPHEQHARLLSATVRLSITDPDGKSTGTGVVIDARSGEALVLTCGHLFRSSQGQGAIELSLFSAGPGGLQVREVVPGILMTYDLERDLAVVRFSTNNAVAVTPVAPAGTPLEPGAPVTAIGCNHGADPEVWPTRITAINRFQGHPNVEAARAPVEGRSGGPLFNAAGQVVGICYAAEPTADEGLYASLSSIHAKLDELQLSMVYQNPSGQASLVDNGGQQLAPAQPFAVRGQNPADVAAASLPASWPAADTSRSAPASTADPVAAPPTGNPMAQPSVAVLPTPAPAAAFAPPPASPALAPGEQAALEEIARRAVDSEVIFIIRPHSPEGRSDVIKLSSASPAFVRAITASAQHAAAPAATAAQPGPAAGILR